MQDKISLKTILILFVFSKRQVQTFRQNSQKNMFIKKMVGFTNLAAFFCLSVPQFEGFLDFR